MIKLGPTTKAAKTKAASEALNVLCVGCHSDDIEIGCGATLLRLREEYPQVVLQWVVLSATGVRKQEALEAARLFGGESIHGGPRLEQFRDGFMPFVGAEVKEVFEQLKCNPNPSIVLTHNRRDAHQDHRLVAELTWNTFRNHLILEYEIPKYDGDLGQPNFFVPVSAGMAKRKAEYLVRSFKSQITKTWFEESTFLSLMRLRGLECNSKSGYAEAFYCRKIVF